VSVRQGREYLVFQHPLKLGYLSGLLCRQGSWLYDVTEFVYKELRSLNADDTVFAAGEAADRAG
jgi:hypothetical protein